MARPFLILLVLAIFFVADAVLKLKQRILTVAFSPNVRPTAQASSLWDLSHVTKITNKTQEQNAKRLNLEVEMPSPLLVSQPLPVTKMVQPISPHPAELDLIG